MNREFRVYEFQVRLVKGGRFYAVRSHKLLDGAANVSTMLIGRGTIAAHDWGIRVDRAGQPYLPTETGLSYHPNVIFEKARPTRYVRAYMLKGTRRDGKT